MKFFKKIFVRENEEEDVWIIDLVVGFGFVVESILLNIDVQFEVLDIMVRDFQQEFMEEIENLKK